MTSSLKSRAGRLFGLVGLVPHRRPPFLTTDWRYHFRPDRHAGARLGPELGAPVVWHASEDPGVPRGDLADIFLSSPGLHKWPHYLPVYERTLGGLRDRPVRFLEIGVDRGGSLASWRQYLSPDATLVGIDINPECAQYGDPSRGMHVRIGPQQDVGFLRSVVDEFGRFDVILDDGSHFASHLVESFRYLFPHGLADGGVYIAEDLQTSYWRHYRDSRRSFIEFAKGLVDDLHAQYQHDDMTDYDFRPGSAQWRSQVTVPRITRLLESVEFHDGVVVIRKAAGPRELPVSVRR